jgi:two-component system, OmpR family, KDP operon response regulator KdpE
MTTILVVDDEPQILRALKTTLEASSYGVAPARSGDEGLAAAATREPELVVLDLGLPDMDGTEVIRRLRSWTDVPIIVLSVRADQSDKIEALDAGADDYVTKPFDTEELLARIRATLRRKNGREERPATLIFGTLEIDFAKQLVRMDGEMIHLTPTEYALLEAMATNPGKLLTHQWLLRQVWGHGYGKESHYLHVYIRQVRQKLNDSGARPTYILTEPGVGYRWIAST